MGQHSRRMMNSTHQGTPGDSPLLCTLSFNFFFPYFRSDSGIVNIYKARTTAHAPKSRDSEVPPVKVIDNLTTPISGLSFNTFGHILTAYSKKEKNALKM